MIRYNWENLGAYELMQIPHELHNFEYGEDKKVGSFIINEKCKSLAKKVKELIDTKSSFADWLTNGNVRAELNQDLFFLLDKSGYPLEWNDEVFDQVLGQVENYKQHSSAPVPYADFSMSEPMQLAAEPYEIYRLDDLQSLRSEIQHQGDSILLGCYRDKSHKEWIPYKRNKDRQLKDSKSI